MGRDHSELCPKCGIWYGGLDDSLCNCWRPAAKDRAPSVTAPAAPAADGWNRTTDNLPSYGQPVWCYWCAKRDGTDGMQGVAVRGVNVPNAGTGDLAARDYWHAEDDDADTRFEPIAWRPLPAPPTAGSEGK